MSHDTEEIVCPNCGYPATRNYCAQCGQPTHLHGETFWGLITHFIGHYFHYDSKFWQTLKALWFSPGKLTIAYWNKQRMRYIPPISLYIFISAVFFIALSITPNRAVKVQRSPQSTTAHYSLQELQTADTMHSGSPTMSVAERHLQQEEDEKLKERITHNIPKMFFFMIPLMAAVLKLFFRKRKDLLFVNHAIFSLHFHALMFSVMLLSVLYVFQQGEKIVAITCMGICALYFIISMKKVYNIGWLRSACYAVIMAMIYAIFAALGFASMFFLLT